MEKTKEAATHIAWYLLSKYYHYKTLISLLEDTLLNYHLLKTLLLWLIIKYFILLFAQSVLIHYGELNR